MEPEPSGPNPDDALVPQKHGGALRRGGGKRPDARKRAAVQAIRDGLPGAVDALLRQAAKGEGWAVKLVLEYGLGRPTEKVELSGPDGGPISHTDLFTDDERRALRAALDAIATHDPRAEDGA